MPMKQASHRFAACLGGKPTACSLHLILFCLQSGNHYVVEYEIQLCSNRSYLQAVPKKQIRSLSLNSMSATKKFVREPWYSSLSFGKACATTQNFYPSADLAWTAHLENNWQIINDELSRFLEQDETVLQSFYANQKKWKSFGLYAWGICLSQERCGHFTQTLQVLKQIPDLITVMVGVMEPQSEIKPHYGDTDAVYRCHLGLVVPGTLPLLGIAVGNEERGWEEGKTMVFNDANYHRTWNQTPHRRIVFIVDVVKPEYSNRIREICAVVLSSLALQKIKQKLSFLPQPVLGVCNIAYPFIRMVMPLYMAIKKQGGNSLLK